MPWAGSLMSKLRGKDRYLRRIKNIKDKAIVAANQVVVVGADMIKAEAQRSITAGSVSGKLHVPSRPGEPPNNDSDHLRNNIETTNPSPLLARVSSNADYAAALEFGTSRMAARPYMRPARDKMAPKIVELFEKRLDAIVEEN